MLPAMKLATSLVPGSHDCCHSCDELFTLNPKEDSASASGCTPHRLLCERPVRHQQWSLGAMLLLSGCCYLCVGFLYKHILCPVRIAVYECLARFPHPGWLGLFIRVNHADTVTDSFSPMRSLMLFTLGFSVAHRLSKYHVVKKRMYFPSGSGVAYAVHDASEGPPLEAAPGPRAANFAQTGVSDRAAHATPRTLASALNDLLDLSGAWCFHGIITSAPPDTLCTDFGWILHFNVRSCALLSILRDKSLFIGAACVACIIESWETTSAWVTSNHSITPQQQAIHSGVVRGFHASLVLGCIMFAGCQFCMVLYSMCSSCNCNSPCEYGRIGPPISSVATCFEQSEASKDAAGTSGAKPASSTRLLLALPCLGVCRTTLSSCSKNAILLQDFGRGRLWGSSPSLMMHISLAGSLLGVVGIRRIIHVVRSFVLPKSILVSWACLQEALSFGDHSSPNLLYKSTSEISRASVELPNCLKAISVVALVSISTSLISTVLYKRLCCLVPNPTALALGMLVGLSLPWQLLLGGMIAAHLFCWDTRYEAQNEVAVAQGTVAASRSAVTVQCLRSLMSLIFPISALWVFACR
eukprot:Gregarina_sp_Pseudo_9__5416@NODE_669_length_2394_cov_76_233546_g632_i0_p1_GENE_NODE_669_length_2394_cov_76_233546_g632_i0NODE_669_length_2394_cov_76_233546_g632_i0_p1_ORF_typecomplete_len615_score44_11_NODE_669_length_2394_cov_76_233546_g632_i0981846